MATTQTPTGRLVLVAEKTLSRASLLALRQLLETLLKTPDVTMVAGLSRASAVKACCEGRHVFYNITDPLNAEEACRLMPWREIWVVAAGRVWCASGPAGAHFTATTAAWPWA